MNILVYFLNIELLTYKFKNSLSSLKVLTTNIKSNEILINYLENICCFQENIYAIKID